MKKISFLLIIALFISSISCEKFVEGYDESPNSPTKVNPALLLSAGMLAVQTVYTGQLARTSSILTQQLAGVGFQMAELAEYSILEGDNVNEWNSIYDDAIETLRHLDQEFGAKNPYYSGIAKILDAMALGIATDFWGDIPNKEACKGNNGVEFLNPHFDKQEDVIADIQAKLDSAIILLSKPASENKTLPMADDFIFGGDNMAWFRIAYVLKARYANRLSKKDATKSATDALAYLKVAYDSGFVSSDFDMNATFGTNGNELSQFYAFENERADYIKMGKNLIDLLNSTSDPRLPFYATPDSSKKNFSGTAIGTKDKWTSKIGPLFMTADAPIPLITYAEAKFIEAEAYLRLGTNDKAADAYNEAVIASVEKVTGAAVPAVFKTTQASATAGTITLSMIMTQKYIALFTQPEVWSDWRRTGIPSLSPDPESGLTSIPRRLPTPLIERVNNTNAIVVSDILAPVWWDQ